MERLTDIEVIAGQVHPIPRLEQQNPSGFEKIVSRLQEIEDILGDTYDLDRLRELVEADKAERCYVLPCKTGDYVYVNLMGKTLPFLIISANQITEDPIFKAMHGNSLCFMFKSYNVGTDVFLTREAAEAARAAGRNAYAGWD